MPDDTPPPAWSDLLNALTLLAKGQSNAVSPLHCEHDELTVMADPERFTAEEMAQLGQWGFQPGEYGTFYSFRYGSA